MRSQERKSNGAREASSNMHKAGTDCCACVEATGNDAELEWRERGKPRGLPPVGREKEITMLRSPKN